jgi:hypothetical protein
VQESFMLDAVVIVAVIAGAVTVLVRAFQRPDGVYVRAGLGVAAAVVATLALGVLLTQGIANEAGFGAFVIVLGVIALAVAVGACAVIGATAGHVWRWRTRQLR